MSTLKEPYNSKVNYQSLKKMEDVQPTLPRKVKMKLVQPAIKCSGRDDVTCYYKGIILFHCDTKAAISFKYKGERRLAEYNLVKRRFIDDDLRDIQVELPKVCCFD